MTLSKTERLDLVAWSYTITGFLFRSRISLAILAAFCIVLSIGSTPPTRETILVAVLGILSLITVIILWSDWRYKVYVLASLWLLFAVGDMLSHDHPNSHTLLEWVFAHTLVLVFALYGWGVWRRAGPYALANSDGFREERDQVEKWRKLLDAQNEPEVAEFTTGDFVTGYWTYRILNAGTYWVVAQFKRGTKRLESCHVYDLSSVTFSRMVSGKWLVNISSGSRTKSFAEIEIPLSFPLSGPMS
jgi:hypothetical protein